MYSIVRVRKLNAVYVKLECDNQVSSELASYFTFKAPNYQFTPSYKKGWWNGDIHVFNKFDRKLYVGLLDELKIFCSDRGYKLEFVDKFDIDINLSNEEATKFASTLNLPFTPHDYQIEALVHAANERRALFLSATSSGKSLTIYMITRYINKKTLIIVDTINLLNQMFYDFVEYGFDSEQYVHRIGDGREKETDKNIVIATWQTVANMPKEWLHDFELIIADEVHKYAAKETKAILEATENANYRFGLTGTLDGAKAHEVILTGLLGPIKKLISAKELMDRGLGSELNLTCVILKYSSSDIEEYIKKYEKVINGKKIKPTYKDEIDFIYGNPKRNNFIINLALNSPGNTIVMFNLKKHGRFLYEEIKKKAKVPVYFVDGSVNGDNREIIRQNVRNHEKSITIASSGCFSTGVNIPELNNIIMSSVTKAPVRVLQTIGRGMRKATGKTSFKVYDISDNLAKGTRKNYGITHFLERLKIYSKEGFKYKQLEVELK